MIENREEIGSRLAKLLREAVAFEGSKKRGRLERDTDLAPMSPARVHADVLDAVNLAKANSKPPRPTDQLKRFQELYAELDDDSSSPLIEPWVWPWLGEFEEHEKQDLSADRGALISLLEDAIVVLTGSAEYKLDRRGGRRSDPNLDRFLLHLAFVYRRYTGYRATYSEDIHGGGQQSTFFRFAAEVLRSFADDEPFATWATRDGALQIAIKRISEFERETYEVGPNDPLFDPSM